MIILLLQIAKCFEVASENNNITWTVTDSVGLYITSLFLQVVQPQTLVVDIPIAVPTPRALQQFCQVVQKNFTGNLTLKLWNSYHKYEKCDGSIAISTDFR